MSPRFKPSTVKKIVHSNDALNDFSYHIHENKDIDIFLHGQLCFQVRDSNLLRALHLKGKGLYTVHPLVADQIIGNYIGRQVLDNSPLPYNSAYHIGLDNNITVDATLPPHTSAFQTKYMKGGKNYDVSSYPNICSHFMNDPYGPASTKKEFHEIKKEREKLGFSQNIMVYDDSTVRTMVDIPAGAELLFSYGISYWKFYKKNEATPYTFTLYTPHDKLAFDQQEEHLLKAKKTLKKKNISKYQR